MFVLPDLFPQLESFLNEVTATASKVSGFAGSSMWRDKDIPERYMLISVYADLASADKAFELMSEAMVLDRGYNLLETAPDNRRMLISREQGQDLAHTQIGELLSLSMRTSATGYGDELGAELEEIFQSLHVIPGFKGSTFGPNERLREEVIGIVLWSDLKSFQASMPAHVPYEIQLYERAL